MARYPETRTEIGNSYDRETWTGSGPCIPGNENMSHNTLPIRVPYHVIILTPAC